MDDKDLKITALKQRIGELASEYEDKVADLRVAITQQEQALSELRDALRGHATDEGEEDDVLEGEVV